ncbi:hypothetical protein BS17DRAFT_805720 [Gyrodon lividus]|nr:hypothetical protein BS17DRAFT_805720 [Gyrodon lividus]
MSMSVVIQTILDTPMDVLDQVARTAINNRLPLEYLTTLLAQDKLDAMRACVIIYILTSSTIVPRSMSITTSPLKRLQMMQSIKSGHYQHLVVSPEQLGMFNGHLPRLARLIRHDRVFTSKISRVHVDEAHNIYTAGLSHHGEDAFRPAYGRLGNFRVLLPKGIPFQALSATLPPHIPMTIKCELILSSDLLEIQLSSNRSNITYARLPLIGALRDFRNLDLLIPNFAVPMMIPKTLIFHDSKQDATDAATYIDARLPEQLQNQGIVKHYHSNMSAEYLQQTFEDFSSPDGQCRIL